MDQQEKKQPLNLVINQVENGYVIYQTDIYRVGKGAIAQRYHNPESVDLRRQWVAGNAEELATLLKKIASESVPLGTEL